MRRKPLNVVFDDSVNTQAENIVKVISELKRDTNDCTINKSEVIRCALDLGLSALLEKVNQSIEKGASPKSIIKIGNIRAMLKK
jgi:hypothetical protein